MKEGGKAMKIGKEEREGRREGHEGREGREGGTRTEERTDQPHAEVPPADLVFFFGSVHFFLNIKIIASPICKVFTQEY
jgi:hypothetical protein